MAIDPVSGHLFVVYTSGAHRAIWLLVSPDAGESWSAPTQVATFTPLKSPPRFPGSNVVLRVGEDVARVAIDPHTGRLFVAFADGRFSRGDHLQIGITASSDGGRTWSPVVAGLSDTTVAAWQPSTTVLADGSRLFVLHCRCCGRRIGRYLPDIGTSSPCSTCERRHGARAT